MSRLPALESKQVIAALEAAGFVLHHSRGSHLYFRHPAAPERRVTVPYHNRDLKKGTLHAIIKDAGLTVETFLGFL